ncbi:MAG: hypothetical protein OXI18_05075 [bacterium]|nr:hypothetical protein [bacterium]
MAVSAVVNRTDELMGLVLEVSPDPDSGELDQLLATGEHVSNSCHRKGRGQPTPRTASARILPGEPPLAAACA